METIDFEWGKQCDPIKLTIPFIHCNMGGEMIYILEQRLYSQKIRKDKIERVLEDVIRQMYNPKVFHELLKEGPLPSNTYVKGIFHTIANSSIMKLSDNSMEKMYELMVMGFKYQMMSVSHPDDLISITLNHIETNRVVTNLNYTARSVIDNALIQIQEVMKKITTSQFHTVRLLIMKFFQDRRTKVSLFLAEGIQTEAGLFLLKEGGPMPNDELIEMPGVVHYHDKEDPNKTHTEAFIHPLTRKISSQRKNNHFDYESRDITLGCNIYIAQSEEQQRAALLATGKPERKLSNEGLLKQQEQEKEPEKETIRREESTCESPRKQAELNYLGRVLGTNDVENSFRFTPFDTTPEQSNNSRGVIDIQGMSREQFETINSELVDMMDELEVVDEVYTKDVPTTSSLLDLLRDPGMA